MFRKTVENRVGHNFHGSSSLPHGRALIDCVYRVFYSFFSHGRFNEIDRAYLMVIEFFPVTRGVRMVHYLNQLQLPTFTEFFSSKFQKYYEMET